MRKLRLWGAGLLAGAVAFTAIVPIPAVQPDGMAGRRVEGSFDLEQATAARKALVDRLVAGMPAGARDSRVRIDVTGAERDAIAASTEPRLRVGLVKALGSPVRFTGQDLLSARGEQAGRPLGVSEARADRGFTWAATLEAPGATALRLHFTHIDLAPGAELYLHTPRGEAFGPYTGSGLLGTGEFWAHTVAGDTVTLQISQPGDSRRPSSFQVGEIGYVDLSRVHGVPKPDPQAGEQLCSFNANCVENANCNAIPSAISNARNAIAHMEFVSGGFLYYCSGGLVNDNGPTTDNPYFLTANHCVDRSSEASSLQNFYQYSVACNGTCPSLYFYNQNPPPFPRTVGATIVSTSKTSDYTLMQLSQPAPSGSALLGWNKTAVANSNGTALYRISHPGGAPQAYSTQSVNTSRTTCRSWPRGAWIYSVDTLGATEGGSSGSPVLAADGRIVGQLSGACGFNVNDVCDSGSNATVDGAFANYYCSVQPYLDPSDTSCGGGGGTCEPAGSSCTSGSECCSGSCKGKPGQKTCG
jgi:V8-like Glu-specific endopeptidase